MALHVDAPALAAVSVHTLVDLFAEGWLMLGVAGLWVARARITIPSWARRALVVGVLLCPLLAPAPGLLPGWLRAGVAPAGVALGLTWIALARWLWGARRALPTALWGAVGWMAIKGAMLVANAAPQVAALGHATGLRIVYLHVSLVGVITVGLIEQAARSDRGQMAWLTQSAVALMIASFAAQALPWDGVRWAAFFGGLLAATTLLGRGVALLRQPPEAHAAG